MKATEHPKDNIPKEEQVDYFSIQISHVEGNNKYLIGSRKEGNIQPMKNQKAGLASIVKMILQGYTSGTATFLKDTTLSYPDPGKIKVWWVLRERKPD